MRLPRKVALPLLFAAGLLLAACSSSGPSHPAAPASADNPTVAASPSPSLRAVRVGQPFDVPGWRVTVTGMTRTDTACVVHLTFLNTGTSPAPFTGTAFGNDSPLDSAVGIDGQGRSYDGARQLVEASNPGTGGTTDLSFDVAQGVRLVRVTLAGVAVTL